MVYFLTEPDFVDLGEVAANKVINANAQVELGRLIEVPTTGAYDIMLFDGSFHCYAYVDKGIRFINGVQSFFTSFNMGLTESRTSVNVLIGNALLTDLPPFLVGTFVGTILSTLISYLLAKAKRSRPIIIAIIAVCGAYVLADLLWIKEVYSYVCLAVLIPLLPISSKILHRDIKPIFVALLLIPLSISFTTLFLFPFDALKGVGLGGLLGPTSQEYGSWLRAYSITIYVLFLLVGPLVFFLAYPGKNRLKKNAEIE